MHIGSGSDKSAWDLLLHPTLQADLSSDERGSLETGNETAQLITVKLREFRTALSHAL